MGGTGTSSAANGNPLAAQSAEMMRMMASNPEMLRRLGSGQLQV